MAEDYLHGDGSREQKFVGWHFLVEGSDYITELNRIAGVVARIESGGYRRRKAWRGSLI